MILVVVNPRRLIAALAVSLWLGASFASGQESSLTKPSAVGQNLEWLNFDVVRGKRIDIREIPSSRLVVVAFLGTECPLARKYAAQLQQMVRLLGEKVDLVGVFSNNQDSVDDIKRFFEQLELSFPAVKDAGHRIADDFAASRTPEVFLLDSNRVVRYRGRVDDQFGIGYAKKAPAERYLQNAIDDLLARRDVGVSETEPVGCVIGRVRSQSAGRGVTLATQVGPILNRHCVGCHQAGRIGPMSLTDSDEIVGWAEMIEEVVRDGRMPPWHADPQVGTFANERRLSDEEKETNVRWVADGAPIGERELLRPLPVRTDGWHLEREPDLILPVSSDAVSIPAQGEMDYQYYRSEFVFDRERWIQAVQILPGNHAVVHHILAFIDSPNGRHVVGDLDGIDGYLAGYVPGLTVQPFPLGTAKRIPANSRLVFQVHYTPIGTQQSDQSKIGIYFADPQSVEREVITTSAIRRHLEIPAGTSRYQVTAFSHRNLDGGLLLAMMPHMHLRGSSFRYELQRTDGSITPLLDVPHFDFHWQTSYQLAKPISLLPGDRICCVATYDNSPGNPNNPDPGEVVRWGDQTREEMMIGYFDIAIERDDFVSDHVDLERHTELVRVIDRYDQDRNGSVRRAEIPDVLATRFNASDANRDEIVTFAELVARYSE